MPLFKAGDRVQRRLERLCSGGWVMGDRVLTVANCEACAVTFEEDHIRIRWAPEYFELISPAMTGRKDDSGKLDMTLLDDMPRAIEAVVEVMQWAIKDKTPKPYDRGSWLGVEPDRYRAAILRHRTAAAKQTLGSTAPARHQRDHETNLLHAAHEACSALMALENILRELENT